jgi:hypothetical protein
MIAKNMTWYPVRCCCGQQKIFGFIKLPVGQVPVYSVRDRLGNVHRLELKRIAIGHRSVVADHIPIAVEGSFEEELAVYSEDRPLNFWRTLPGFLEAADQGFADSLDHLPQPQPRHSPCQDCPTPDTCIRNGCPR